MAGRKESSPCLALLPWEAELPVSIRLMTPCPIVPLIPVPVPAAIGREGDLCYPPLSPCSYLFAS